MKIGITSTGPTLDDNVEARFGRCAYFLIVDTDTMQFETVENPNIALGGGAGIQSAQLMSEKGVTAVLTGNCGPNAFNVFGQAGIRVIVGVSGHARNAVEQFKAGVFSSASRPNVASHFGMGGGGSGMGRGRGMGRGMGRDIGMAVPTGLPSTSLAAEDTGGQNSAQELTELKQREQVLEQKKQQLNQRISHLESVHKAAAFVLPDLCAGCGI